MYVKQHYLSVNTTQLIDVLCFITYLLYLCAEIELLTEFIMIKETIGANAGAIWNALENGALSVKAVKKATKLKEAELNMALGWLAREGKVVFTEVEGEVVISLV